MILRLEVLDFNWRSGERKELRDMTFPEEES